MMVSLSHRGDRAFPPPPSPYLPTTFVFNSASPSPTSNYTSWNTSRRHSPNAHEKSVLPLSHTSQPAFPPPTKPSTSSWAWKLVAPVRSIRHLPTDDVLTNSSTDLIELGLPFTDPIADGPTIQKANTQALKNGVTVESTLETVRKARRKGLRAPVLFMGYYNPLLSYGEERILRDAKEAGVNGFIVVDLPPEEAVRFRNFCTKGGSVEPSR